MVAALWEDMGEGEFEYVRVEMGEMRMKELFLHSKVGRK